MKYLFLLLLLGLASPSVRADEIQALLQLAQPTAAMSETVSVWLNYLNTSSSPRAVQVPSEIDCTLSLGAEHRTVRAALKSENEAGEVTIPAGGFIRREFSLQLPPSWAGEVQIASAVAPGQGAVLPVGTRPSAGASTANRGPDGKTHITPETDPVGFFQRHFFPHEPFYFIAGTESPNAKFQISFKYKLVAIDDPDSWWESLYVGYTQTSLWDWNQPSAPFFDSSYRPEALFSKTGVWTNNWLRLDLAGGIQHESNGRDGADSRSLNIAYLRPTLTVGDSSHWFFSLAPRAWFYLGDLSDNPDLKDYRGYVDLRAAVGSPWGVQLAALLRSGRDFDRGSAQFDLTVPLWEIAHSPLFLQVQYFNGYGESLLNYNQREDQFRIGFGMFR